MSSEPNPPVPLPLHPDVIPLARDSHGRPFRVPANGAGWLVWRHTGGRPRMLLDATKRQMILPLHYSYADLDDILSPGDYKLGLANEAGALIEVSDASGKARPMKVAITITGRRGASSRNADEEDDEDEDEYDDDGETSVERLGASSLKPNGGISDVRYLLAANVRATRLAFEHNQRTLESGLRIAETLRESVQVLADSQTEIIKAVVSSRMPRNAAFGYPAAAALPAAAPQIIEVSSSRDDREDSEDSQDDDEDAEPTEPAWLDKATRIAEVLAPAVNALSAMITAKFSGVAPGSPSYDTAQSPPTRSLGVAGFELSDLNWTNAYRKSQAAAASAAAPASPTPSLMQQVMGDAALLGRIMAIKTQLPPEDSAFLLDVVQQTSEAEQRAVLDQLRHASVSTAVEIARRVVADLRAKLAAAAPPPTGESVPLARVAVARVPASSINDPSDEHLTSNPTQG